MAKRTAPQNECNENGAQHWHACMQGVSEWTSERRRYIVVYKINTTAQWTNTHTNWRMADGRRTDSKTEWKKEKSATENHFQECSFQPLERKRVFSILHTHSTLMVHMPVVDNDHGFEVASDVRDRQQRTRPKKSPALQQWHCCQRWGTRFEWMWQWQPHNDVLSIRMRLRMVRSKWINGIVVWLQRVVVCDPWTNSHVF